MRQMLNLTVTVIWLCEDPIQVGNAIWAIGVAAVGPGGGQCARQQRGCGTPVYGDTSWNVVGVGWGGGGHEETWA